VDFEEEEIAPAAAHRLYDGRLLQKRHEQLAVGLYACNALLVDGSSRWRERCHRRFDRQAWQRVWRQGTSGDADQLGIRDRAADARTGEAERFRQSAQHDQIVPSACLGGEARCLRELEIGLVQHDDRVRQRVGNAKHQCLVDVVSGRIVGRADECEFEVRLAL
jgi:hypothetical protein